MALLDNFIEVKVNNENNCKGLFWRGEINKYIHNKKIVDQVSLRFLKKRSCTGCPQCDWLWDYIQDTIHLKGAVNLNGIEHSKIYTYYVNSSQGYYDLYPEIERIN